MNNCSSCFKIIQDKKILKCKFCDKIFCNLICLMDHSSYHLKKNISKNNIINSLRRRHSDNLSYLFPFITSGNYIENPKFEKKYSLDNFSKVIKDIFPILLGSGSFGKVYLIKHNITHKEYAMKIIDKKKLKQMGYNNEQILEEIKIHSKLDHENIVHVYNVFENEENFNIIMEYAKKGNLYDVITREKGGLSEEKAVGYFTQVVNAVYYLHQNNIIHRDIKPENILISENDIIKLCDFGWAKELNLENRNTFCGTAEYMAPEIVTNENYDFSVDIWSLGILLYEMIFGHSPFEGKNKNSIMINIKSHELIYDKPISNECKDLIEKILENNPQKRLKIKNIIEHSFIKKYKWQKDNSFISEENDLESFREIILLKKQNMKIKKTFTSHNINIKNENEKGNEKYNNKKSFRYKRNSDNNIIISLRINPNLNKKEQKYKNNHIYIQNFKKSLISQLERAKKKIEDFNYVKNEKYTFEDFRDKKILKIIQKSPNHSKNKIKIDNVGDFPKKNSLRNSKLLRTRESSAFLESENDLFFREQNQSFSLSEKNVNENNENISSSLSDIDNSAIKRLNNVYKRYGQKENYPLN